MSRHLNESNFLKINCYSFQFLGFIFSKVVFLSKLQLYFIYNINSWTNVIFWKRTVIWIKESSPSQPHVSTSSSVVPKNHSPGWTQSTELPSHGWEGGSEGARRPRRVAEWSFHQRLRHGESSTSGISLPLNPQSPQFIFFLLMIRNPNLRSFGVRILHSMDGTEEKENPNVVEDTLRKTEIAVVSRTFPRIDCFLFWKSRKDYDRDDISLPSSTF